MLKEQLYKLPEEELEKLIEELELEIKQTEMSILKKKKIIEEMIIDSVI